MSSLTDFNDLHQTEGSEAVKACIEHAIDTPPSVADDVEGSVQVSNWAEPKEIKSDLPLAPAFDAKAMLPRFLSSAPPHSSPTLLYNTKRHPPLLLSPVSTCLHKTSLNKRSSRYGFQRQTLRCHTCHSKTHLKIPAA